MRTNIFFPTQGWNFLFSEVWEYIFKGLPGTGITYKWLGVFKPKQLLSSDQSQKSITWSLTAEYTLMVWYNRMAQDNIFRNIFVFHCKCWDIHPQDTVQALAQGWHNIVIWMSPLEYIHKHLFILLHLRVYGAWITIYFNNTSEIYGTGIYNA